MILLRVLRNIITTLSLIFIGIAALMFDADTITFGQSATLIILFGLTAFLVIAGYQLAEKIHNDEIWRLIKGPTDRESDKAHKKII